MTETIRLLAESAERIFADLCGKDVVEAAERGEWPRMLWDTIDQSGLMLAAAPESAGGAGLSLGEAFSLLRIAGRYAAPLPFAETIMASALLGHADMEIPSGPLSFAAAGPDVSLRASSAKNALHLAGDSSALWARHAPWIVVAIPHKEGTWVGKVRRDAIDVQARANIAGEPRDEISFDGLVLVDGDFGSVKHIKDAFRLAALSRCVLMAGALESILSMSVKYALDRQQFGRPIGKFQAVQQQIAVLAGEVAAAIRASDAAMEAFGSRHEHHEIAIAKARIGEAASRGAAIAHQVHGAMGFTHEHPLHQRTRRLWCWREEFGNEAYWNRELGRAVAKATADGVWAFVTRTDIAGAPL